MGDTPCHPERAVAAIFAAQDGVISMRQATAAGMSERMARWRLATGRWEEVHELVFRHTAVAPTFRQQVRAACLAARGGVASHRTAATLCDLDIESDVVEITVPVGAARTLDGVIVHRTRRMLPADVSEIDGLPVTRPARTLLDLTAVVGYADLEAALDSALRGGHLTIDYLSRRLEAIGTRGRPRAARLRRLLEQRSASPPSGSRKEAALRRAIIAAGLPSPVRQFELRDRGRVVARFDLAWPTNRVAVEYESDRWHETRQQRRHDRARANAATALGWLVLVATADHLGPRRSELLSQLTVALNRAS